MNYKVVHWFSQPILILFSYLNDARHNLVIGLCRALMAFWFFACLVNCRKVLYLLHYCFFQKCKVTFIAQESSQYLVLTKLYMWTGLLFLLLVYIKMFEETKLILASIWKLQWLPSTKDNVSVFIYSFAKNKTMSIPFLYTKRNTLYVKRFSWNFEVGVYIQNHDTFRYVTFYVQKSRHFAKSKTIYIMFLYTKSRTLCVLRFSWDFWNWRSGGTLLYAKTNAICVTFIFKKLCTLRYFFISNIFRIAMIPNYKRR